MVFCFGCGNSTSQKKAGTVIDDNRTYSLSWRSPTDNEFADIGRIMVKNNVTGCGEYYVKEVTSGEFVAACTSDGKNWNYYVVYTKIDKIYLANNEMLKKLTPPR